MADQFGDDACDPIYFAGVCFEGDGVDGGGDVAAGGDGGAVGVGANAGLLLLLVLEVVWRWWCWCW